MKRLFYCFTALALLCCVGYAQTPPAGQPASNVPQVLPAKTPLGTGPFKAIMEVDPILPKHTVYRPNDISAIGSAKLPIMAWGNGACAADGNAFRLRHHGQVEAARQRQLPQLSNRLVAGSSIDAEGMSEGEVVGIRQEERAGSGPPVSREKEYARDTHGSCEEDGHS